MKEKAKKKRFADIQQELLAASREGIFGVVLSDEDLSEYEAEIVRVQNEIAKNYKDVLDYDMMKYRLTSDALGIALWDMDFVSDDPGDRNNRLIWSPEVRQLLGFSDEKDFPNLLSSLTDRIHPEDREKAVAGFVNHIMDKTGKTPFDEEYRLMMKNGEYRFFHAFGKTLRDSDGNPLRVAGAIEDIEDKKRMQESLRKAEEEKTALSNLSNILNGLNSMICVTDPETDDILFINDIMQNAFSAQGCCTGQKCYKVFHNLSERCGYCPCTELDKAPDKEVIWEQNNEVTGSTFRCYSRYISWPGGKTVHIQNAVDITDIREAEREIAENNEFARIILEYAPVGVTFFDENFKYINCNDNILKMYGGITREQYAEFFGSPAHSPEYQPDGSRSSEKAMDIVTKVVVEGENLKTDWVHNMPDGQPFPVELTLTRIKQDDRYIGLAYIYDMREQTRLKEEIKEALYKAEDANRAKSDFLAKMSHEIRTPMNAILGLTEIQMRSGLLSEETEEALNQIYDSGSLLMGIINDILDLSKIEADKLEIIPVLYDITSMVNDTAQLNRMRSSSELIDFDIRLDKNTPHKMIGDELRIKQILNNVLSNAFKYTKEGRIEFSIFSEEITPDMRPLPNSNAPGDSDVMLIFCVSDTGQGMTEEQLEILFTDYTRFNLETNRTTTGTGLGLSITRHLADLMGGSVLVESEVGVGSVFTIRIPQKRHGKEVCGQELAEKLRDVRYRSSSYARKTQFVREYMPYGSVLVVDDVESNIYVAKGMLVPYGMKIDTALSGFEAIEKIENGNVYDIVFMDHMMPEMDGVETTKKIRSMGYEGTIVALTANAVIGQSDVFLQNGFNAFVSKPIDSRELNHILNEFIRNKKPPEVVEEARREQGRLQSKSAGRRGRRKRGAAGADPAEDGLAIAAGLESLADTMGLDGQTEEGAASLLEMKKLVVRDAVKAVDALEQTFPKICLYESSKASGGSGGSGGSKKAGGSKISGSGAPKADTVMDKAVDRYVVTVHGMKTALANIGETEMSAASLRLELAGKERDFGVMTKETPGYMAALRAFIDDFEALQESHAEGGAGKPDAGDADMGLLKEKLLEIKAACETYNVTEARAALESLTSLQWPKEVGDALEELNMHLLHSAFKKAAALAEQLGIRE